MKAELRPLSAGNAILLVVDVLMRENFSNICSNNATITIRNKTVGRERLYIQGLEHGILIIDYAVEDIMEGHSTTTS